MKIYNYEKEKLKKYEERKNIIVLVEMK